jgi:hypothetical protein
MGNMPLSAAGAASASPDEKIPPANRPASEPLATEIRRNHTHRPPAVNSCKKPGVFTAKAARPTFKHRQNCLVTGAARSPTLAIRPPAI